jgi:hypothetical protein
MILDLAFEPPGDHVQEAGPLIFRLYEKSGHYVLPDVVLRSAPGMQRVELQEASVTSVTPATGDHGPLAAELSRSWGAAAASAGGWISGRYELATPHVLPAGLADRALGDSADRPAELVVTWHYVFTDRGGVAAAHDVQVRLLFMARGVPPPTRVPASFADPYAVRHNLPAVLRHRGGEPLYMGFAAVDFGTSSCAVALSDTRQVVQRSIDEGQAARLRAELARLLADRPPPPLLSQWSDLLDQFLAEVQQRFRGCEATDAASLAAQLDGPAAAGRAGELTDGLLDAVCLALQKRLADCGPQLAQWLAPRLLACFDTAFTVPNLDELRLREVVFHSEKNDRDIASSFRITAVSPVEIELGTEGPGVERGLKAKLFKGEPRPGLFGRDGREATTDDLIAHVYQHLAVQAEHFARPDLEAPVERLVSVVATYPTTTAPAARQRLGELLGHCLDLDRVVTRFDEGVAAGLFFLMRDFGSRRWEFGAEALRARARRVGSDPPTWQQNMLLIDIGAGTTDIALIGLTLQDITADARDGADPLVRGRHYVIKPEVLNSTGHAQLGGNYLTLRVFYWLKAAILDALLTGPGAEATQRELAATVSESLRGERPNAELAPMVASGGIDEPAPPELARVLRATLPTHWSTDDPEPVRRAFGVLWELAERTKIAFGESGSGDHAIDHTRIRPVLHAIDERNDSGLPPLAGLLPEKDLVLPWEGFEALARPVLRDAARLAAWLVRTTFDGIPDARLDRVALSGKTSRMPLLSQVVTEVLATDGEAGSRLPWNPAALAVETERAKQAAALGACWAQSILERGTGGGESELDRGRTLVTIDVENLFHSLPCGFELMFSASNTKSLLRAGAKMIETDATGALVARSKWEHLLPTFEVHRPKGREQTIQWGVFKYYSHHDPDGFQPDPAIWGPSGGGARDAQIMAMLEVDQGLTPYLHLCHGDPHYYVGVAPEQAIELRDALDNACWSAADRRLRELPAAVWVAVRDDNSSRDERVELFAPWPSGDGVRTTDYFNTFFHEERDLESVRTPGRISVPLPPPPALGDYVFYLRWPDGAEQQLPPLHATGQRGLTARYVATLDVQGSLRLHRGEPPFWAARSLRDVERIPGSVLRIRMDEGVSDLNPGWDPFSGRH